MFHPAHDHWHFEGFARYELREVNPDGTMGAVLRTSDKVSFCLIDTHADKGGGLLPHYGWGRGGSFSRYASCRARDTQGISVGYGDLYHSGLAGQSLDITGLPSTVGTTYWVISTADPQNLVLETDEGNNAAAAKIRFQSKGIEVIS